MYCQILFIVSALFSVTHACGGNQAREDYNDGVWVTGVTVDAGKVGSEAAGRLVGLVKMSVICETL